jgi:hypothetical protein
MRKILIIPAYIWAFACFILIPVTFIKNDILAQQMARLSFMKIHPRYSGGKEKSSSLVNGLNITIYEPVYNGLTGGGTDGFVQVKFSGIQKLSALIHETIDYNFDNTPDFEVSINTSDGATELKSLNSNVKSLAVSSKVKEDWLIRVNIERDK